MQLETNNKNHQDLSWQDDFRDSLKSLEDFNKYFNLNIHSTTNYKVFLPKSFAKKIKNAGMDSVLAKQFVPSQHENSMSGLLDPIGDKVKGVSDGIIHRYKNRILFTTTTICPIICRYCFRKNELSNNDQIYHHKLSSLKRYLINHPEVNEVILTGGDPLIVSDQKLEEIFTLLNFDEG